MKEDNILSLMELGYSREEAELMYSQDSLALLGEIDYQ